MKYEKANEDIWTVSKGTFIDGTQWRIQKVAGVYYYGVLRRITDITSGDFHTEWVDLCRSTELSKVLEARNNDPRNVSKQSEIVKTWAIHILYDGMTVKSYSADSFVLTDDRVLKIYSNNFGNVTDKLTEDEELFISEYSYIKN